MDRLSKDELIRAIELLKSMHGYVLSTSEQYGDFMGWSCSLSDNGFIETIRAELKDLRNRLCILRGE